MSEIQPCNKKEECRRLWKETFGDSDAFIEHFIRDFYDSSNMLCIEEKARIVSMLHMVPFKMGSKDVGYIYAVATEEKSRGKGYATLLIEKAIAAAKAIGYAALVTIPADEGLRLFYSRFGFTGSHPVTFKGTGNFDFGTGEKRNDVALLLPLEGTLIIEERMSLVLEM